MSTEGWQRRRVREFSERLKRVNTDGLDLEPLSITKDRGVILQSQKYNKRIATDPRKYVFAEDGDFAFDPMSLYYGAIGRVEGVGRGLVSPDYVVFKADPSVDPDFLHRLLRYPEMHKLYESLSETGNTFGKRRRLYWSIFEEIELELPPRREQTKIAAILSSVDQAIEATQAVIKQLQVVKKAMMAELLTRGLPGRHTRFKQTEIGEIPCEWEVLALEQLARTINNGFVGKAVGEYVPFGVPYLMAKNVREDRIDRRSVVFVRSAFLDRNSRIRIYTGDVLTVQSGHIGTSCVVSSDFDACGAHALIITRPIANRLNGAFLSYYLNSQHGRQRLSGIFVGSTVKHINTKDLRRFLVPVPDIAEQASIERVLASVDDRTASEIQAVAALRVGKAALMSVLLTGEVRVKPDPEPA